MALTYEGLLLSLDPEVYYPLSDTGSTLDDASLNANDAPFTGGITADSTTPANLSNGIDFDASADYATVATGTVNGFYATANDATVTFWHKGALSSEGYQFLLGNCVGSGSSNNGWGVIFDDRSSVSRSNSVLLFLNPIAAGTLYTSQWDDVVPTDSDWHFYAITVTGQTAELFVDGVSQGTQGTGRSGAPEAEDRAFLIGAANHSSGRLNGIDTFSLSDFAVFYTLLSDTTISDLYSWGTTLPSSQALVTVDAGTPAAELTEYPMLIDLSTLGPAFWETVANGGGDIRCFLDDGTPLSREVVSCDTATDTGELWVKIPTLSVSTDTVIEIHADGVSAEPAADSTYGSESVWGDYALVTHDLLTDSTGTSTLTNTDGVAATGQIGAGLEFDGGGGDYVDAGSNAAIDNVFASGGTFTGWMDLQTLSATEAYWAKRVSGTSGPQFYYQSGLIKFLQNFSGVTGVWEITAPATGIRFLSTTYDASSAANNPSMYLDGVSKTVTESGTPTGTVVDDASASLYLGNRHPSYDTVEADAILDEFRFRKSVLTSTWITTEHANQSDPYTFYQATTPQSAGTLVATVTIDATEVAGTTDLTDFPVLLDLSQSFPAGFWSEVRSDGGDIRVYRGTQELPREVVSCDNVGETGEVWVKVDTLSYTTDTDLTIYLDGAPDYAVDHHMGRNAVWADYVGVWHLEEDPTGTAPQYTDSTGNGHNGTFNGTATIDDQVAGPIGNAVELDGSDDYISIPDSASLQLSTWTLSAIANTDAFADGGSIISKGAVSGDRNYMITASATGSNRFINFFNGSAQAIQAGLSNNTDYFLASTYDGANIVGYLNDATPVSAAETATPPTSTDQLEIGRNSWFTGTTFNGTIDEVRITSVVRSADWITTEYNNQSAPGTFYSVAGVGGTDISATTESLSWASYQATVSLNYTVSAAQEALALTTYASTVARDTDVSTAVEQIALTTYAGSVATDRDISAAAESLQLSSFAATVSLGQNISAQLESLTLTTSGATVALDVVITAALESLGLTTYPAGVATGTVISAALEELSLTTNTSTVALDVAIQAALEQLALTTYSGGVALGSNIGAQTEQLSLSTFQGGISLDVTIPGQLETLSLTTLAATVGLGSNIQAFTESLVLTPYGVAIQFDTQIEGALEQLTLATFSAAIQSSESDLTAPGLEFTIPLSKMGYTIPISRIHFIFKDED